MIVREMEFKMERQGLVNIGDVVDVTEREGFNYSYIIEPAVAMSGCYKSRDRLKSKQGVIKDIKENSRGFYVIAEFDEPEISKKQIFLHKNRVVTDNQSSITTLFLSGMIKTLRHIGTGSSPFSQ